MFSYILKKTIYGFSVLIGIILLLSIMFFAFLNSSADPAKQMTGQRADEATLAKIRKEYLLDKPVHIQFLSYINDLSPVSIHSNESESMIYVNPEKYNSLKILPLGHKGIYLKTPYFRKSYQSNKPVAGILADVFPDTFILALAAMLFACFLGIFAGTVSALNQDTWIDRLLLFLTSLGVSAPSFFVALAAASIFGFYLHNYTGLELHGGLFTPDSMGEGMIFTPQNLVLPALTLGIRPLAVITQITRNSMLDVLQSDYVRTAKAKGLSRNKVVYVHTLRNALNPVLTSVSGWFAGLLAGSVFVEYIFGWNGIGKEIIFGLQMLDYPLVMGALVCIAFMFTIVNILTDILYSWADPSVKLG